MVFSGTACMILITCTAQQQQGAYAVLQVAFCSLPGSNTKVCCVSWVVCVLQLVAA